MDSLTLRALTRTASGKGGGRNTETEVITTERWLQKQRFKKRKDKKKKEKKKKRDEGDN